MTPAEREAALERALLEMERERDKVDLLRVLAESERTRLLEQVQALRKAAVALQNAGVIAAVLGDRSGVIGALARADQALSAILAATAPDAPEKEPGT